MKKLSHLIRSSRSILFVGIGNVLKHDDGSGVFLVRKIEETDRIKTLVVEQSIENYIGKINTINPNVLVLVDCLFFNKYPGFSDIIPVEELQCQTSNTHNISLKKISELFNMPVFVLGMEPENIMFGEGLTQQIQKTVNHIADEINMYSVSEIEK